MRAPVRVHASSEVNVDGLSLWLITLFLSLHCVITSYKQSVFWSKPSHFMSFKQDILLNPWASLWSLLPPILLIQGLQLSTVGVLCAHCRLQLRFSSLHNKHFVHWERSLHKLFFFYRDFFLFKKHFYLFLYSPITFFPLSLC